ncbi:hypothetical protein GLOIN_2v869220 [Rhizophagus irregularis DAOM 181602=DAOM 197198]|uniref:Uncharacterized protein n=1 Tax=Rhizophagus irregularis (strain DAOM 181602 / DAOM 197198 / MUCL 43194) TaxID=747089 RepID=A0A2P4QG77_RHIID|nr:hypothetical protein GLOIN_2v869220 [Rhizophagus irregularis DAOM 181602=DAOM 197198]POG76642.1 hypothetical protein GLOIN_2v869220 [Rhizophagus irregularis DAOM 181602=DAOM 197198]GET52993.1 hypothetical protein GLOIN_2v869220 [Rhizophagus irregularis DAOM 181602=DAOM 197198]|eukprot:XP_025183508.1 hypothetical protein GLOIN_2v869220 [Rhizophagus irregularis DAOM 181602=DAOM 197198]
MLNVFYTYDNCDNSRSIRSDLKPFSGIMYLVSNKIYHYTLFNSIIKLKNLQLQSTKSLVLERIFVYPSYASSIFKIFNKSNFEQVNVLRYQ